MNLYAIKEKCQHGSIQVPYSYYDCGIPDYFTSVPLHWHSEMELNYIKSGNGFFKYEDQTISAKPGDIFLIQPNVLHAIMSDEHSSFFMIPLFFIRICWWEVTMTVVIQIFCCRSFLPDEEFWSLYLRKPRGIMNSMIRSDYYAVCAQKSCDVGSVTEKRTAPLILSAGIDTGTLYRTHDFRQNPRLTETLRPVLTYIQKHHSESVTIEQLAKIAHMSSSYFMSCFKQNFGLGAIEYLNQVRIRSACDLLRNTDRNISDIAFDTGFHNLSNFNRQFRTKVGCSPQTYRKESVLS